MAQKWKSTGYLAKTKTGKSVLICIGHEDGKKDYYIADLGEALEVLTGNKGYTKIMRGNGGMSNGAILS